MTSAAPARPASITPEFLQRLVSRVPSTAGGTWKLTEVYTGEVLIELPQSTPADIEAAAAAAREAQAAWAATPLKERLGVFKRAHELFLDQQYVIADLIQVESGKGLPLPLEKGKHLPEHFTERPVGNRHGVLNRYPAATTASAILAGTSG